MTTLRLPFARLSDPQLSACIAHLQALLDAIDPSGPTAARLHFECKEALAEALREDQRRSEI